MSVNVGLMDDEMRTIKHATVERMIPDRGLEDDAPDLPNDPGNPRKWVKEDRMGGRKGKGDRISERRFTGEARLTHEHIKFQKKQFFHQ